MKKDKKLDDVLAGLLMGIIAFTIVCQLGMFFVESMLRYTIGLWIGALLACASAYHMWWSLDRNLTVNADNQVGARAFAIKQSMIRYFVIVLVFVAICLTDFAYPLAAFLVLLLMLSFCYIELFPLHLLSLVHI